MLLRLPGAGQQASLVGKFFPAILVLGSLMDTSLYVNTPLSGKAVILCQM